jgi:hypothetical protein
LRWIKAGAAESVYTANMDRFNKLQLMSTAAPQVQPDTVGTMTSMTGQLGLATVPAAIPAAWPIGVSPLAQAVDACQRSDTGQVRTDWLARAQYNRAAAGFLPG